MLHIFEYQCRPYLDFTSICVFRYLKHIGIWFLSWGRRVFDNVNGSWCKLGRTFLCRTGLFCDEPCILCRTGILCFERVLQCHIYPGVISCNGMKWIYYHIQQNIDNKCFSIDNSEIVLSKLLRSLHNVCDWFIGDREINFTRIREGAVKILHSTWHPVNLIKCNVGP